MNTILKTETQDRRTERNAAAASALFHLLLLLLFMLFKIGEMPKPAEWIEISLAAGQSVAAPMASQQEQRVDESDVAPLPREETPPPQPIEKPAEPQPTAGKPDPLKANLPQRRMLEEENPEMPVRGGEKITREENVVKREDLPIDERPEYTRNVPAVENPRNISTASSGAGDSTGSSAADLGEGLAVPFSIEGEAANRVVLHRVIPEFPPGVRRSAAVRIRFTVLADGQVGPAILVQKGEARLEKVALDAFRQWRFNALPSSAGNRVEQGVITFRFLLK
jgi:TonB family protein